MNVSKKDEIIVCYGKEYSAHEYIKMNICANRGTNSAIFKERLVEMAIDRNIPLSGKETKEQLFDKLCDSGISDREWEEYGRVGIPSKTYQDFFHITHQDVKRLENFGVLTVIGHYAVRKYGKYLEVPLYSLSQFLDMKQERIDELLEKYPKGKRKIQHG